MLFGLVQCEWQYGGRGGCYRRCNVCSKMAVVLPLEADGVRLSVCVPCMTDCLSDDGSRCNGFTGTYSK